MILKRSGKKSGQLGLSKSKCIGDTTDEQWTNTFKTIFSSDLAHQQLDVESVHSELNIGVMKHLNKQKVLNWIKT